MNIILIYVLIALLWWMFAFLHRDYLIDSTQIKIGYLRDELFDYALSRNLLKTGGYLLTEKMLNGLREILPELNLPSVLIRVIYNDSQKTAAQVQHNFSKLTKSDRDFFQAKLVEATILAMRFVFLTSVFLLPIYALLKLVGLFSKRKAADKIADYLHVVA